MSRKTEPRLTALRACGLFAATRLGFETLSTAYFSHNPCAPETTSMISRVIAACLTLFMYRVS